MSRIKSVEEEELEVNMTPMLDIVFIMLIFFIVTAVFVKEPGIEVEHSHAGSASEIKRISTVIAVAPDNKIWLDKKEISLNDVRYLVSKIKQENSKGNIVIRADKNSHAGLVVKIVEQLNQIGVAGVSISARDGGEYR